MYDCSATQRLNININVVILSDSLPLKEYHRRGISGESCVISREFPFFSPAVSQHGEEHTLLVFLHSSLQMPHSITTTVHGHFPSHSAAFHLPHYASSTDMNPSTDHHSVSHSMSPHFSLSLSPGHLLGLETIIPKQEEEDPSFQRASAQLDGVYDLVRH